MIGNVTTGLGNVNTMGQPPGGVGGGGPPSDDTLASLYQFGLGDDPDADNRLAGSYFDTFFDVDGHTEITQHTASDGSDFDRNEALLLQRFFSTLAIPGLVAMYSQRYAGSGSKVQGGVQMRARLVDNDGAATFWTQTLNMSTPTIAQWYDPVLAGDRVGQVNWDLRNITGGTTPIYWNSDGAHFRSLLFPSGGESAYRLKAEQLAMVGYAGFFSEPKIGSAVSHTVTGPAVGPGDGPELARWDIVLDDSNFGSAQAAGHHEWYCATLLGGELLALQLFDDQAIFSGELDCDSLDVTADAHFGGDATVDGSLSTAANPSPAAGLTLWEVPATIDLLASPAAYNLATPLVAGKIFVALFYHVRVLTRDAAIVTPPTIFFASNGTDITGNFSPSAAAFNGRAAPVAFSSILTANMPAIGTFPISARVGSAAAGGGLTSFTCKIGVVGYYR